MLFISFDSAVSMHCESLKWKKEKSVPFSKRNWYFWSRDPNTQSDSSPPAVICSLMMVVNLGQEQSVLSAFDWMEQCTPLMVFRASSVGDVWFIGFNLFEFISLCLRQELLLFTSFLKGWGSHLIGQTGGPVLTRCLTCSPRFTREV